MVRATHSKINMAYVAFIILYFITVEDVYCVTGNNVETGQRTTLKAAQLNSQLQGSYRNLNDALIKHKPDLPGTIRGIAEHAEPLDERRVMVPIDKNAAIVTGQGIGALGKTASATGRGLHNVGDVAYNAGTYMKNTGNDAKKASQNLAKTANTAKFTNKYATNQGVKDAAEITRKQALANSQQLAVASRGSSLVGNVSQTIGAAFYISSMPFNAVGTVGTYVGGAMVKAAEDKPKPSIKKN